MLVDYILRVAAGEKFTVPSIFTNQREFLDNNNDGLDRLTKREHEVLSQVGEGKKNPEIAEALKLSVHSVENYINKIKGKLGVTGRDDLVLREMFSRLSGPG